MNKDLLIISIIYVLALIAFWLNFRAGSKLSAANFFILVLTSPIVAMLLLRPNSQLKSGITVLIVFCVLLLMIIETSRSLTLWIIRKYFNSKKGHKPC